MNELSAPERETTFGLLRREPRAVVLGEKYRRLDGTPRSNNLDGFGIYQFVAYHSVMLFMVIETFQNADLSEVEERLKRDGRLLPEGVTYHSSWVEPNGARCFQIMEAADVGRLNEWASAWGDLVSFEIVPVETSEAFWAKRDRL